MHEVTLRLEPGGPYGAPTRGTDAVVELWCNDHCDLLSVRGDGGERVLAAIEERVGVRDRIERGGRTLAITAACLRTREGTVERHLERHGCLLLPPLRYARGAKICRVLALDPADLTDLYRDLVAERSVTVESKRAVDAPSAGDPMGGPVPSLTDRQREVLLAAHEMGYYERPRETSTAAVGDAVGVSRRTAEEHLRRAERKLTDAIVERLRP